MRLALSKTKKFDYIYLLVVLFLCFFGIIMISSSSMVISMERFGSNYHYVVRQIGSLVIGMILMFITYSIDYRKWKQYSLWLFLFTVLLLVLVFIPGIGHKISGSQRWIGFGNYLFQPSEIIKLSFIIYLAAWLDKKGDTIKQFFSGFIPFAVLIIIIGFLIMKQPDLGTMSIITGIAATMFFISGADLWHLALGLGSVIGFLIILIKAAPYRIQRLLVFLNPTIDNQGASYHINQALLAIGTGGLLGLGFGQSRQKYLYLPMAHTDSIIAIIAEELGFVRTSLIILIFVYLGLRGLQIAKNAPDTFSRLLAVGITAWIMIQTFINISAMLGVLPMTGVPLPFVSYGGSSLIVLLAACGIMLNISKSTMGDRT